jgi:hypothetical protein
MRTFSRIFCLCVMALGTIAATAVQGQTGEVPGSSAAGSGADSASATAVAAQYGQLPLAFEANRGQASDPVRYLAHSAGQLLLLEKDAAVLHLAVGEAGRSGSATSLTGRDDLSIHFVGANEDAEIVPLDEQPGKSNYILGDDPAKWHTNIENYSRVRYKSLYPGVDLIFYGNPTRLEHDFIVAPGADYRSIGLQLSGSQKIRLENDGSASVRLANGSVKFSAPRIYQVRHGQHVAVQGGYTLKKNLLAFHVGAHDAKLPLVIDPVLSYSTFLAGSQGETAAGIAIDSAGNAYVTGLTFSSDFPTETPYQPECNNCAASGSTDVFVTKLNATGTALVYSTYLGGSGYDQPYSIAVDDSGHAIVAGVRDRRTSR